MGFVIYFKKSEGWNKVSEELKDLIVEAEERFKNDPEIILVLEEMEEDLREIDNQNYTSLKI